MCKSLCESAITEQCFRQDSRHKHSPRKSPRVFLSAHRCQCLQAQRVKFCLPAEHLLAIRLICFQACPMPRLLKPLHCMHRKKKRGRNCWHIQFLYNRRCQGLQQQGSLLAKINQKKQGRGAFSTSLCRSSLQHGYKFLRCLKEFPESRHCQCLQAQEPKL